ncbi:uncharacterized protein LOC132757241 [Ruditapes philippinarum]|uniref:uncharacterized protein LOC132757241 n=1 Tax=Ruditapes philippinarum TaxID=129788 RepID=UPI00295AF88E|nr:uncharacterized protein LOC132757241 [Ruditapes philippinarum]
MAQKMNTENFEVIALKYLEQGRIYTPAREFINKISLRFPGVQDTEKRQKLILDMVNLVKTRLATYRNKKTWRAWLQEAAIQLDSAQIAHRDWISSNIWILKDKPVRKPDPPSPREDDISDDILALSAGEEEVAALLESPSSSPKVPMEVSILLESPSKVSVEIDPDIVVSSPRRSPRKAIKKSLIQEPSRNTGNPKPMVRAESSGRREKRASSPSSRHASHQERKKAKLPVASSSEVPHSQPAQPTRLSVTFGRTGGDRSVAMGRGMTIDYPKPFHPERRAAPPPASSWKKQRTEDTLLKVRKAIEEKRSTGKRRSNKRMNVKCWVPNCLEPAQYMKVHAFKHHVPGIFDERLQHVYNHL